VRERVRAHAYAGFKRHYAVHSSASSERDAASRCLPLPVDLDPGSAPTPEALSGALTGPVCTLTGALHRAPALAGREALIVVGI
jgi:hypothetical protein